MNSKKIYKQTRKIEDVIIIGRGTVGGAKESQGPLASTLDRTFQDSYYNEKTWEKCESKMQKEAINLAISESGISQQEIDLCLTGDLLNQCIGSSYCIRDLKIPYYGQYGACSTIAQSLSIGSMLVDGGYSDYTVCGTSSHFCTAERQFRTPLEYGGQRTPTAQWTVTGSGMLVICKSDNFNFQNRVAPKINAVTTGKIIDMGIKDITNMGAAMAPAAADTLITHFNETQTTPADFDMILTGDLGVFGKEIVMKLIKSAGFDLSRNYQDCGEMIYNIKEQDMHAGGSGCGCSALVFCGHIMNKLRSGELKKVLFLGTGALMSTISIHQGESIPSIAHAISVSG